MKTLNILLLSFVVLAVGCKTQKIAPKPEPINSETSAKVQTTTAKASNVAPKEERVTAAKGEASDLGSKRFYIILGSFSDINNAQSCKKQLMSEGFFPGILVNESQHYRVSVDSYDDETMARTRISDIRQKFPNHNDVWLLVKKQ